MKKIKLILTFIGLFCGSLVAAETNHTKPNIILILTDDLGWADVGVQDIQKDIRTPNIDAKIEASTADFKELEAYILKKCKADASSSGCQEYLKNLVNEFI